MIAVIFEFTPAEGRFSEYMDLVGTEVVRDYTMDERTQAPADSLIFHSKVHG